VKSGSEHHGWVYSGSKFVVCVEREAYEQPSPITYASAITTPTLILHDTGDQRVPITNSYAIYHALKENGVTVKFIASPVAGHFPDASPLREADIDRVWLDWFDPYLK
jgi:dipeptidyl aminopeptidase/acylaminoacyl peptidase